MKRNKNTLTAIFVSALALAAGLVCILKYYEKLLTALLGSDDGSDLDGLN